MNNTFICLAGVILCSFINDGNAVFDLSGHFVNHHRVEKVT